MKKIFILLITIVLCSCTNKEKQELNNYKNLVNELKSTSIYKENDSLNISVELEKLSDNYYNYRVLIDKPDFEIKDIVALVITNEETDELYPSMGIFEEKISLSKESKEKGIKLSGYTTNKNITFKVYISYLKDNKEEKYYYIIDNPTYIDKE